MHALVIDVFAGELPLIIQHAGQSPGEHVLELTLDTSEGVFTRQLTYTVPDGKIRCMHTCFCTYTCTKYTHTHTHTHTHTVTAMLELTCQDPSQSGAIVTIECETSQELDNLQCLLNGSPITPCKIL